MRVRHPNAVRDTVDDVDDRVSLNGETYAVDSEGVAEMPDRAAEAWAARYGLEVSDIQVQNVCGAEMSDGSTCERPANDCPYH